MRRSTQKKFSAHEFEYDGRLRISSYPGREIGRVAAKCPRWRIASTGKQDKSKRSKSVDTVSDSRARGQRATLPCPDGQARTGDISGELPVEVVQIWSNQNKDFRERHCGNSGKSVQRRTERQRDQDCLRSPLDPLRGRG